MSTIKHLIRLKIKGYSNRKIGESLGLGRNTVNHYIKKIGTIGYSYPVLLEMGDEELYDHLANPQQSRDQYNQRIIKLYDLFPSYEQELQKSGVTRRLLWQEYKEGNQEGLSYGRFCEHYGNWKNKQAASMHMEHKLGDKVFVDFTGKKLFIIDGSSGEVIPVEVFVAVLGGSQYTYVEAIPSQGLEDFLSVMANTLEFFGGCPKAIVPDNLKAAVKKSSRYAPVLNESFADFSAHYQTTVLPARAYKPRDKALVEGAVKIVYSRIFAPLRNQQFFSLVELNEAIQKLLKIYNTLPLSGRDYSRQSFFDRLERQHLTDLPAERYLLKKFTLASVQKNCHAWLSEDKHYYSVPYSHIGEKVKIAYTKNMVEIYSHYQRIAVHERQKGSYGYTTEKKHLPSSHRFVSDWHPDRFLKWATKIGPYTTEVIQYNLEKRSHPEQGFKSCMGILSLGKKMGDNRLEMACKRACYFENYNYQAIKNILYQELEAFPLDHEQQPQEPPILHENLRGNRYYNS